MCKSGMRHEGKSKLVAQIRKANTRARDKTKILIASSYDIRILCSNMRIKANRANYDMELEVLGFESRGLRHEEKLIWN